MSLWGSTGGKKATSLITFLGQPSDGDTITLGAQTYTFQTSLVDSADNVAIGGDVETTRDNLIAAINAGAGAGTAYGTGTTANADVTATSNETDKVDLEAKVVGTSKNSVATTTDSDNIKLKAGTLEEGINPVEKKPVYLTPDERSKVYATDKGWALPLEFLVSARQTFEFSQNPDHDDTIVIDSTTYTFKTTLTGTTDGEILIGANTEETTSNLVDAIIDNEDNRESTFGYNTGTHSPHSTVDAYKVGNESKVIATAKTPGSVGNAIEVSITGSYGSWNKPVLQGGQDVKGSRAQQKLTFTQNTGNGETVDIGSKTYTFETLLTDVDGNVQIGADVTETIQNLIAAINLDAGSGTKYAASMTIHPDVTGHKAFAEDVLIAKAKVFGKVPNAVTVATNVTGASWADSTLKGGVDEEEVLVSISDLGDKLLAASIVRIYVKDLPSDFRFDENDVITVEVEFNEKVVWTDGGVDPVITLNLEGNDPAQRTATIKTSLAGEATSVLEFDYTVQAAGTAASQTFNIPNNNFVNDETITINTTQYTFKTSLTGATDGEILIGQDAAETRDNILDAINDVEANREVTFGYGSGTHSPHPEVIAEASGADVVVTAKKTGTTANSYDTLDGITDAGLVWGGATMSGGVDGDQAYAGGVKLDSTSITLNNGTLKEANLDGTASSLDAENDFNNAGNDGATDLQALFDSNEANLVTVNQ